WILLVSAVLVASVLGYFLVQRFWPLTQAATTPSQKAFLRSALGEQALLWFREIQAAPSSRVSDTVRNESQDWIGTIDDNSTLEPEVAKRARVALFEHIHACWWDQQAAAGTRRGDPPVVDLDASRIPKDDLQAIWKATATRDNDRYPAGPPPTDANLQLAVIRRWLSLGSSPCTLESKPGEALSQGNNSPPEAADPFALWKSLIGTRGPEVRALFAEAQTGGRPPVTVTPKASQGFKYWQGIEAAKFEGDVLGLSLTASFEYLHARWVKEKGLAGAAPTVDFDVSRIDAAALAGVRTWVGLSRPLPEGGTATTPAVQAEVVRAWLDKKKNPS
ncbi:MAG TPA: hypothetical protein VN851_21825, partial [Thermoanaerobaculia bacterium]|nr:hypothetical protein [Thermoanaerobaculia bacterium]